MQASKDSMWRRFLKNFKFLGGSKQGGGNSATSLPRLCSRFPRLIPVPHPPVSVQPPCVMINYGWLFANLGCVCRGGPTARLRPSAATHMFATSSLLVSQAHPMQKAFSLLALEKRPFLSFFYGPATCSTYTACGTPRCGWNHLRCFPSPRACLGSSAKPDEEQQLADLAGAAELRPRAVPCE